MAWCFNRLTLSQVSSCLALTSGRASLGQIISKSMSLILRLVHIRLALLIPSDLTLSLSTQIPTWRPNTL